MEKGSGILKKSVASFQLSLLIVSLFAFSYMIYSVDVVSSGTTTPTPVDSVAGASGTLSKTTTLVAKKTLTATIGTESVVIEKGTSIALGGNGGGTFAIGEKSYSLTATQVTEAQVAGNIGAPTSKGWLSSKLGLAAGKAADALVSGLQWAGIAYMAGQLVGGLFGMDTGQTKALSYGLGAGFGSYKALQVWDGKVPFLSKNPGLAGAAIGAIVFVMMYKRVDVEIVTFDCMAWQAPTGGNDCEVCNDDNLPCSEYRCRALGQACEIVNQGTEEERCVYVNPRDVVPPVVRPRVEALSRGHEYVNVRASPPGPGFGIVNTNASDGCLKAFTPLEFGLVADEPAQCKIDFEHTESFDEMSAYVRLWFWRMGRS